MDPRWINVEPWSWQLHTRLDGFRAGDSTAVDKFFTAGISAETTAESEEQADVMQSFPPKTLSDNRKPV